MKLFKVILVWIIFFSSAYPCLDAENFSAEKLIVEKLSAGQVEPLDNCSPFCVCSCCSISYKVEDINSFNKIIYSANSAIHFQDNYLFNPFLSIWQPPRI